MQEVDMSRTPELVPILSPGRHRSPRQGACFMEFASFLAGERWSDHPACTHPLLAALARDVNDLTSDRARAALLPLVHRVVGLRGDDPRVDLAVAVRAATSALPIASMERQRALATGLLAHAADLPQTRAALTATPDAARWAREHLAHLGTGSRHIDRATLAMVHTAAVGIALACVADADERLRTLLEAAIADVEALSPAPAVAPMTVLAAG